jgi:hypothetical protein
MFKLVTVVLMLQCDMAVPGLSNSDYADSDHIVYRDKLRVSDQGREYPDQNFRFLC